jgi:hypothetical protein
MEDNPGEGVLAVEDGWIYIANNEDKGTEI